jgi:C4-dicarboxylate-binding protein DctP
MESPIYVKTVEALGGNAVPIAWGELYTSLQTGVVDGQENPVSIIELGKLYEVQKYLTMDGHTWSESMMIMNDDLFKDLPKSIQQSIKKAAHHGTVTNRSIEEMKSWITSYKPVNENMEIYTPNPEEIKKFRETAQPEVLEWLRGEIGDKVVNDFLDAVDKAEKELDYK